jgi:hypothetical protein
MLSGTPKWFVWLPVALRDQFKPELIVPGLLQEYLVDYNPYSRISAFETRIQPMVTYLQIYVSTPLLFRPSKS